MFKHFQVRASAVFALGTFVSCNKDHTDHGLNVDQSIAITLLNTVAKDMSPMVREVIVKENCILRNLLISSFCILNVGSCNCSPVDSCCI